MDVIDDFVQVGDQESFAMTRELVSKEGICVGPLFSDGLVGSH
jgi:cysteine synthase